MGPTVKRRAIARLLPGTPRRSTARRGRRSGAIIPMTEIDTPLRQVVGGHLYGDPIARQNADAILLHTTRRVRQYFMSTFQGDAKTGVRQDFADDTFEFDEIFLGQGWTFP